MKHYNIYKSMSLILFLLSSIFTFGQKQYTENTLKLEKKENQEKHSLNDINWLAGSWVGKGMGGEATETWNQPQGNSMIGMFQLNMNGKVLFYEFCQIIEKEGGLILRIKHFNKNLVGWETKEKSVEFPLIKIENNTAWLDGLTYKREGNKLYAWVAIEQKDGKIEEGAFTFNLKE